jgi:peptidoglycan hydrolase CwlO-like protein
MKFFVALALPLLAFASTSSQRLHANPIRKVVTMLQDMQKSVEAEGEKEKELFEKFMCYCNNGAGALDASIEAGKASIEQLTSKIEKDTALKSQLEQDIVQHKSDREEAEKTIKESTAMREKEAEEYAATSGEMKANVEAMGGALAALKKGLSAAMLQTGVGQLLRNVVANSPAVSSSEREMLTSFLESGEGGSDQIIGIVSQMKETMEADLKEATATEEEAKASFATLTGSKTKEIAAAGKAVEKKTARVGEVAVEAVQAKADLEGTEDAVDEDTKFKANLAKECATKQKEWDERQKLRAQELEALSETIEMLNGDDALELFKKTLPSGGAAVLLQTGVSTQSQMHRARSLLENLVTLDQSHTPMLRMMLLALHSRSGGGFDKVVKMIDDMVTLLSKEQTDDDKKKDFCIAELNKVEAEKTELEGTISDLEAEIEELEDGIATTTSEIADLKKGLEDLDKSVVEATEQRKEEHAEYTDTAAANQAAVELIGMAKNRMNKFYNPSQYKAPPTTTESSSPYGFVQLSLRSKRADPGPPPETFGEFKKSDSGGVLGMMDQMVKDVEMDMQEAKMTEANSQEDYEQAMSDAAVKREKDSKSIVTKEGEKAETTSRLEEVREGKSTKESQLGNTTDKLNELHQSCDFLLDNYDSRKEARAKEADGLKQSKAVLAGASFGFLQRT